MLKNILRYLLIIGCLCGVFAICTNIKLNTSDNYELNKDAYQVNESNGYIDSFAFTEENTIIAKNDTVNAELFSDCYYALMIDDTDKEVLAAKDVHKRMYPASLTKLMTAIIVADKIEAGEISLEDEVTVTKYYDLTYDGVEPCSIDPGSVITIKNLLYDLMISSNNYYALILADYIAGSEEEFCRLMNEKAVSIGATNTHYVNPHGLDDPEHYSTAYDTYLIIKEANRHDVIKDIETFTEYSYTYINGSGYETDIASRPTNMFLLGMVKLPSGYTIQSWKTGTTDGAGNCLAMVVSKNNKTYVAIAAHEESRKDLYDAMIRLLCLPK